MSPEYTPCRSSLIDSRRTGGSPDCERTIRMQLNERFYDDSAFLPIGSPMPAQYYRRTTQPVKLGLSEGIRRMCMDLPPGLQARSWVSFG